MGGRQEMQSCWCFLSPWKATCSSIAKLASGLPFSRNGHVERRVAKDGCVYTIEEFIRFYGEREWQSWWDDCPTEEEALAGWTVCQTDEDQSTGVGSGEDSCDEQASAVEVVCAQCGSETSCTEGKGAFLEVAYCEECWSSWRASVATVPRVLNEHAALADGNMLEQPSAVAVPLKHFDFIEVGTSDWGTISQYCDGDVETGSWTGQEIRTSLGDLRNARGIAVDVVGDLLASLPNLERVTKVEAGMSEFCGEAILYYVSTENISKHMGSLFAHLTTEVDVMWYAKSMASIGKPHPELEHLLQSIGRKDLMEQRAVTLLSWGQLCTLHGVETVDVLQLDCEGMDCNILRGLIRHCKEDPSSFPRVIVFEANYLTVPEEIEETLDELCANGYRLRSRTWQNITVERT